jgi:hypothetical protein
LAALLFVFTILYVAELLGVDEDRSANYQLTCSWKTAGCTSTLAKTTPYAWRFASAVQMLAAEWHIASLSCRAAIRSLSGGEADMTGPAGWLGRQDSNLGMAESKSAALPLGYAPMHRRIGRRAIAGGRAEHSGAISADQ